MASHQKETDTLPVILGQALPNVGAKVCGSREKGWKRCVRPLLVMVLNLKLRILDFASEGGKKTRHGVKRRGFKFWLCNIPAMCLWANEVLRSYFYLLIYKMGYYLLYALFPQDCSENQMRLWILNPEPYEFWLWSLQSFLHYITFTWIFLYLFYVLVLCF